MEIRPLREADDRTTFHSGEPDLDRFLIKYAGQNQFRHHIGTTYVVAEESRILAYATVAAGHLEVDDLPRGLLRKLPRYPLPVLRLARLAVHSMARKRGLGKELLRHVFLLALTMSKEYGCVGLVVDAKPDAVEFYTQFGFSPLEVVEGQTASRPEPTPLFLPLDLFEGALEPRART
jgi:GNAT superfamily N-acetyltransferase